MCKPIHPEPPIIKENLEPVIAGARKTLVLRCVITGQPVPELTWRKDETIITSKQHTTYENFTATLTLNDTTEHTTGLYSCSAVNSAGSAQTSASVVIQGVELGLCFHIIKITEQDVFTDINIIIYILYFNYSSKNFKVWN